MPTVIQPVLTTNFSADLCALNPGTPDAARADWFDRKAALLDVAGAPDLAQPARDAADHMRAGCR